MADEDKSGEFASCLGGGSVTAAHESYDVTDAADCWPPWFNELRQSMLKAQLLDHNMAYQTLQQTAQYSAHADAFKWILEKHVLKTALQFDGDVSVLCERSKAGHDDWWPPWFTDAVHAPLRAQLRARGYTYDQLHGWATSARDHEVFQGMLAAVLRTAAIPYTGDVAELWENIKTARPPTGKLSARALVCVCVCAAWRLRVWQQWHEEPMSAMLQADALAHLPVPASQQQQPAVQLQRA